jgi:hypothetical protein
MLWQLTGGDSAGSNASMSFAQLIDFAWQLPLLVANWAALVYFGRVRRDGTWRCMLIGLVLVALYWMVEFLWSLDPLFAPLAKELVGIAGVAGYAGGVMFAVGVALRAIRSARATDRVKELEMIIEAQNEQLSRQGS